MMKRLWLVAAIGLSMAAGADDYADRWGLPVGTHVPDFELLDQRGVARDFTSLAGERGLLLFFNRSTDW